MAKAEDSKKGYSVESATQYVVRGGLKKLIEGAASWVHQHFPELSKFGAWIYTSKDASKWRKTLDGSILAVATVFENIADRLPVPGWFREGVESLGGDLPGNLEDYYKLRVASKEIVIPADYTGPKVEDIPVLMGEFATKFREGIRDPKVIADLRNTFDRASLLKGLETLGLSKSDMIIGAILGLENAEWKELARLWTKMSEQEKHAFTRLDKFLGQPAMLTRFLKMTPLERKIFLEMAEANQHRLLSPDQEEQFRIWRRSIARYGRETLQMANQGLEGAVVWLADNNASRRIEISDERYSPENLEKMPWRREELPPDHPNRYPVARQLSFRELIKSTWLGWIMFTLFIGVVVFAIGAAVTTRMMNEAPHLLINSPENWAKVSTSSVRLIGQASDDHRVSQMSYTLNNQMPRRILVASGPHIDWTTEVKNLKPGPNTIRIDVRDGQGRHNSMDIRVRYVLPADSLEVK